MQKSCSTNGRLDMKPYISVEIAQPKASCTKRLATDPTFTYHKSADFDSRRGFEVEE